MNKNEFLSTLQKRLSGLPESELEDRLTFYAEMIEDRTEEGMTEEEAVAEIGPIDDIVRQILSEIPLTRLVRENKKPPKKRKGWEIALLILGSPVWLSLLIAAIAVLFSLCIALWSVVIALYAVVIALGAAAVGCVAAIFVYLREGNPAGAVFAAGASLICAGAAILLFFVSGQAAKGLIQLSRKMLLGIKSMIIGKGDADNEKA